MRTASDNVDSEGERIAAATTAGQGQEENFICFSARCMIIPCIIMIICMAIGFFFFSVIIFFSVVMDRLYPFLLLVSNAYDYVLYYYIYCAFVSFCDGALYIDMTRCFEIHFCWHASLMLANFLRMLSVVHDCIM